MHVSDTQCSVLVQKVLDSMCDNVCFSVLGEKPQEVTVRSSQSGLHFSFQFGDEDVSSGFCVVPAWTCLQSLLGTVKTSSLLPVLRLSD